MTHARYLIAAIFILAMTAATHAQNPPNPVLGAEYGVEPQIAMRAAVVSATTSRTPASRVPLGAMTPTERRAAIDAYWGDGAPTADKLAIFDAFWNYVDRKFAAFQGIDV